MSAAVNDANDARAFLEGTWIIHSQTAHFDTRSLAKLTYPARMTPLLRNSARFSHHGLTVQNTGPTSRQNSPCRPPADLKLAAFSSVVHIYSHSPHHPLHILIIRLFSGLSLSKWHRTPSPGHYKLFRALVQQTSTDIFFDHFRPGRSFSPRFEE
jgi:hypothetical protein